MLGRLWGGEETLLVISSDLSHYHDYDTARRRDAATAAVIERGDWAQLGADDACGYLPVAGLLVEAARRGLGGATACALQFGRYRGRPRSGGGLRRVERRAGTDDA